MEFKTRIKELIQQIRKINPRFNYIHGFEHIECFSNYFKELSNPIPNQQKFIFIIVLTV